MIQQLINRLSSLSIDAIYTRKLINKVFKNKTVALVGGGAEIFNYEYGREIDNHDIIVRFNLMDISGTEKYYGSRTDVRVIGATLLNKHLPFLPAVTGCPIIITNFKNYKFLKHQNIDAFFYGALAPRKSFKIIDELIGSDFSRYINQPPRSGLFFLLMLLDLAKPSKISLFGISTSLEQGMKFVSYIDGTVKKYDERGLTQNHCSPEVEAKIIRRLEEKKLIKIYS